MRTKMDSWTEKKLKLISRTSWDAKFLKHCGINMIRTRMERFPGKSSEDLRDKKGTVKRTTTVLLGNNNIQQIDWKVIAVSHMSRTVLHF